MLRSGLLEPVQGNKAEKTSSSVPFGNTVCPNSGICAVPAETSRKHSPSCQRLKVKGGGGCVMFLCYFVSQSSSDYGVRNFIIQVRKFNVEMFVNSNEMFSGKCSA